MSGIFRGLMMGASKQHWVDIIKRINGMTGSSPFYWGDIQRVYPDISKSELSRLKCSGFLIKIKGVKGRVQWRLNPDCNKYINPSVKMVVKKKVIKK